MSYSYCNNKIKVLLFLNDKIMYIRNLKEYINKFLELIWYINNFDKNEKLKFIVFLCIFRK